MSRVAQQALLGASAAAAATLAYQALSAYPTTGQTITFTGVGVGAEAGDRRIYIAIWYRNGYITNVAIASVTIGGVLATIHGQAFQGSTSNRGGCAIVSALVPTGTTADVVITWASNAGDYYLPFIAVYRATGVQSGPAHDVAKEELTGHAYPAATVVDVAKGGFVIVCAHLFGDSTTASISGVTQDYMAAQGTGGTVYIGGSKLTATAGTLSATISGPTYASVALVMASFR